MTAVLVLQDVEKSFKRQSVIANATFAIQRGDVIALTGPNGSGKSVLLRLCCRLLTPDSGGVWIAPELLDPKATFPAGFGVVIDRPGFIPHQTGFENLMGLAKIRGLIAAGQVEAAMSRVGLIPDLRTPVARYSLGMRQKLALAQAFMEEQEVLVLDEPFNGLDRESIASTRGLLREFEAEGRTILFTSHNDADIEALASRRLEINSGRVEEVAVRESSSR